MHSRDSKKMCVVVFWLKDLLFLYVLKDLLKCLSVVRSLTVPVIIFGGSFLQWNLSSQECLGS